MTHKSRNYRHLAILECSQTKMPVALNYEKRYLPYKKDFHKQVDSHENVDVAFSAQNKDCLTPDFSLHRPWPPLRNMSAGG